MAGLALPYLLPEVTDPDLQFKKYINFLLALMSRRAGDVHVHSKPFDISINPSTACQLHCPYCQTGNGKMDRPVCNLSPELHRHMISGIADELFIIRYFGTGESLLNRRFVELLGQVKGKEIFTFITSNLSLKFTDQQIDELILSGLNVLGVSLDGAEQKTYGRYRVGGSHELVVANMLRIIERRDQMGSIYPLVQWRFLVFKHNVHEVPLVRELAKQYRVDLLEFVPGSAPAGDPSAVQPVDKFDVQPSMAGPAFQRAVRSKNTLLQQMIRQKKYDIRIPPNELKFKKCDWHYVGSYWYPDGGVGPCCHPTHIPEDFGTVTLENSFEEIWNGERYKVARDLVRQSNRNTDNFCSHCPGKAIMDRFFVTTMRGILLNAPGWVLKILSLKPDVFFYPVDSCYLHAEFQAIADNWSEFAGKYADIQARMAHLKDSDSFRAPLMTVLIELLEQNEVGAPSAGLGQRIINNLMRYKR